MADWRLPGREAHKRTVSCRPIADARLQVHRMVMKATRSFKSRTASLGLMLLASQGCSRSGDLVEEHGRICRQNMKVIVHDEVLWREYRAQSEAAHKREIQQDPPITWRPLYISIGDFTMTFGDNRSRSRPSIDGKIVRNDIFIIKGDKTVVQIVDFLGQYRGIDGVTALNCLGLYENLIIGVNGR